MRTWLKLGEWNTVCDSCGRRFKSSMLRKRWDGLMVCEEDWEVKHPQLSLRVPVDDTHVPWARPEAQPDYYIPYCTLENSQGIVDLSVVDCAVVDYISPAQIDPGVPNINDYPAIAGQAVAGISISGLVHTLQVGK